MTYCPKYEISTRLLNLLTEATELRTWIAETAIKVPWVATLRSETAFRLAHSSTSIEGNPLSLQQVKNLAQGKQIHAGEKAKSEVLDYLKALRWIEKQSLRAVLTEKAALKLHKLITQNTLPTVVAGAYKTKPNRIVDSRGHTIYQPPGPKQARGFVRELIEWINESRKDKLHPVIVSAVAHHRLVSIHPFTDGNGRVARALAVWILYSRDFDTHHLFALDDYFEADRQKYYGKIQQARELDGVLTYWLEYVAEAIIETLMKTKDRIADLRLQHSGKQFMLSARQEEVLRLIQVKGKVRAPEIMTQFRLTRSRVNQILKPLVEAGVILQEGQTRATTYRIA